MPTTTVQLSLELWSCDDGEIRMTATGQASVFDIIRVLGGQKSPHKVWERLCETHSEVLTKCQNHRFPGRGQRETPVAKTKEDVFYILGLLPGTVGRKYREEAARLFVSYLKNPAKLAGELAERLTPEESEWLEARLNTKRTRHVFGDTLKEHGVINEGYARCTNAIYRPLFGADAKTLKARIAAEKNIPIKKVNNRDHMNTRQLGDLEFTERVASGQIKAIGAHGNREVEHVCAKTSEYTRQLLDGAVKIPGL